MARYGREMDRFRGPPRPREFRGGIGGMGSDGYDDQYGGMRSDTFQDRPRERSGFGTGGGSYDFEYDNGRRGSGGGRMSGYDRELEHRMRDRWNELQRYVRRFERGGRW